MSKNPTHEEIEVRAYELYLDCGCQGGHDLQHWLEAEQELDSAEAEEVLSSTGSTQVKAAAAGRQIA